MGDNVLILLWREWPHFIVPESNPLFYEWFNDR